MKFKDYNPIKHQYGQYGTLFDETSRELFSRICANCGKLYGEHSAFSFGCMLIKEKKEQDFVNPKENK